MTKIINKSDLVVNSNLIIDKNNHTIELIPVNGLDAKDGVNFQTFYSKIVDLWNTTAYQTSDMPMHCTDVSSGKYKIGTNGINFNSWKLKNQTTYNLLRDGGLVQYNLNGTIAREDTCIRLTGSINQDAQLYYQFDENETPIDFLYTDKPNILIQVFGDMNNGNFDKRSFFKIYCREQGRIYKEASKVNIGPWITNFYFSNPVDPKIIAPDSAMSSQPYSGIHFTTYLTNVTRHINNADYPFNIIFEGNNATVEEIYTKIQYLRRLNTNIDSRVGSNLLGKTSPEILSFFDNILRTTSGAFIDNVSAIDIDRQEPTDVNNVKHSYPAHSSVVTINFSQSLVNLHSFFCVSFNNLVDPTKNYGGTNTLFINDLNNQPLSGVITSNELSFIIDYDNNSQGGRTAGTPIGFTAAAISPGNAIFTKVSGVIERNKNNLITLSSSKDLVYSGALNSITDYIPPIVEEPVVNNPIIQISTNSSNSSVDYIELYTDIPLSGHRVVIPTVTGCDYASNTMQSNANLILGITVNAANAGDVVRIQSSGLLVEPSWNWIPDSPVFLGLNGLLTQVPPTSGFQLIIGISITKTAIFIKNNIPISIL